MSAATGEGVRVDIVIDNFNYGRYIAEAIHSARAQTHPGIRLIVVDDGSSDDSRKVIESLADQIDEVVLKENGGQASAINAGLARCEGEVVIFLDADDVLLPHAAATFAAAFAANPALTKAQARMEVIDSAGRPTGVRKPPDHLPLPSGDLRSAELAYPFDLTWLPTTANAFRVEALRGLGPIPEADFRVSADWFMVHLTALVGPVVSLPRVCSRYRIHGDNNYELELAEIDLPHLRATIGYSRATARELLRVADERGFPHPREILSIADLSNRMISLRLEPDLHPLATDTRAGLVFDAMRALRRRRGVGGAMKAMFAVWFAAMAVLPRSAAAALATRFLFPERRVVVNKLLGRLHRQAEAAEARA
jgi:glycosyltransferase involved in cell wall biosynthesis